MFKATVVAALSLLIPALVAGQSVCPFLPSASAPAVEYILPGWVLSTTLSDLPVKFVGVNHKITRKQLPYGATPKVTVKRYSSKPIIDYDAMNNSVTISTAACALGDDASSAPKLRNHVSLLATAVTTLAAMVDERTRPYAMALAVAGSAASVLPRASARELQACTPSVEVVVEAPASYRGAVETCKAEINDPEQCPLPFPTFPTCDDAAPICPVVLVGAGAGGLYTALRMVDSGKISASDVCVFEQTERVGGRLMSMRGLGPDNDLTVDAGGYRTWPQFTPTIHALITEYLGIPMDCYDKSEEPCQKFNIVDENGKKAGFSTFVEEMMSRLIAGGACFYPNHELERVVKVPMPLMPELDGDTAQFLAVNEMATDLYFTNGVKATSTFTTILNIPQQPLLKVMRKSNFDDQGLVDAPTLDALHSAQTVIASKLYLYYPKGHVFWRKLGLETGDFEFEGDARNMLLAGRYHDGHVDCDDPEDPNTCHGFLLAVYANDNSGNKAQYFRRYQRERPEPVTFISNTDLEGRQFLKHAHERLVEYHLYEKTDGNYTGFEANKIFGETNPPEFAVLSTWNGAVTWAGGAWHSWTDLSSIDLALEPFVKDNIFVVNEAFSLLHGWAEGSVKLGDQILFKYFGIERPWSFPVSDFNQIVSQTASSECADASGDGTTSGGSSGGGSSGGTGGEENVLCFTADALVSMSDGSTKRIEDVKLGDLVTTGTGLGVGRVTDALVHPVFRTVPVVTVPTKQGNLVGTPAHPILNEQGEWVEIGDWTVHGMQLEQRYVEAFYNLEIDGDVMAESSHSYVVNGVVASGLGDHVELNLMYPRQKVWKEFVDASSLKEGKTALAY